MVCVVVGFDLRCSRSSTKDLADDDDVDFLHSEDANVRDGVDLA